MPWVTDCEMWPFSCMSMHDAAIIILDSILTILNSRLTCSFSPSCSILYTIPFLLSTYSLTPPPTLPTHPHIHKHTHSRSSRSCFPSKTQQVSIWHCCSNQRWYTPTWHSLNSTMDVQKQWRHSESHCMQLEGTPLPWHSPISNQVYPSQLPNVPPLLPTLTQHTYTHIHTVTKIWKV